MSFFEFLIPKAVDDSAIGGMARDVLLEFDGPRATIEAIRKAMELSHSRAAFDTALEEFKKERPNDPNAYYCTACGDETGQLSPCRSVVCR